jgi:hypothetical protein
MATSPVSRNTCDAYKRRTCIRTGLMRGCVA